MSSYRVLAATSDGLRRLLWNSFVSDPVVRPLIGTEDAIVFLNPTDTVKDSARRLSLWLYHVSEDEHVKNTPNIRLTNGTFRAPPLTLDLYYLLTPFSTSGEADHLVLGRAMQTLYDQGTARIVDTTGATSIDEELRISLYRRSLDEISQVWQALREPYRLSVCYQVKVTHIDSGRMIDGSPVIEVGGQWSQDPNLIGAI
jgi:Pvc16 N-terminal domain